MKAKPIHNCSVAKDPQFVLKPQSDDPEWPNRLLIIKIDGAVTVLMFEDTGARNVTVLASGVSITSPSCLACSFVVSKRQTDGRVCNYSAGPRSGLC